MMKNIIIACIVIGGLFLISGCSEFLKEESQSEVIPKTTSDFSELLFGSGYPTVSSPRFSFLSLLDDDCAQFLTYIGKKPDAWVNEQASITYFPYYSWQPYMCDQDGYGSEINAAATSTIYAQFYSRILGCNAVLDYIDDAVGDDSEKHRVKAEALAVRSLLYFQLVNIYGEPYNYNKEALGVPLRMSANLTEEHMKRETVGNIYEKVIAKGLQEAAQLMDPLEIIRKNYRVNQPAIHILLSRVYLYMERYQDCIDEVNKAIDQGIKLLDMVNNLGEISSGNLYRPISYKNPEVEWLFGPAPVSDYSAYALATAPDFRALWDEENDRRFLANNFRTQLLRDSTTDNTVLIQKPKGTGNYGQSVRSAEAFLNRMEAYALLGEEELALSELNDFRKKRIIDYQPVTLSGQSLLDEIRLERRKELCYEGHRWFDLRRQGMPEIRHVYKYEKGGDTYEFILKEKDPMYTIPLPNSLLLQNSGLIQNDSRNMEERQSEIMQ